jgi:GNAT superfamily N-acetyltransferase
VSVRRATPSDVAALTDLVRQYWEFESLAGFDQLAIGNTLEAFLALPEHGSCWLAETSDGIVGYLLAVLLFSLEYGGMMAEIDELFVLPAHRSDGTGSALLHQAERELRSAGVVHLQLQLGIDNQRGRRFYARHGFRLRQGYELLDKPL